MLHLRKELIRKLPDWNVTVSCILYPFHCHREQGTVAGNLCLLTFVSYATGHIEIRELCMLDSINISGIWYHFCIKIELGKNDEVLGVNRNIIRRWRINIDFEEWCHPVCSCFKCCYWKIALKCAILNQFLEFRA